MTLCGAETRHHLFVLFSSESEQRGESDPSLSLKDWDLPSAALQWPHGDKHLQHSGLVFSWEDMMQTQQNQPVTQRAVGMLWWCRPSLKHLTAIPWFLQLFSFTGYHWRSSSLQHDSKPSLVKWVWSEQLSVDQTGGSSRHGYEPGSEQQTVRPPESCSQWTPNTLYRLYFHSALSFLMFRQQQRIKRSPPAK